MNASTRKSVRWSTVALTFVLQLAPSDSVANPCGGCQDWEYCDGSSCQTAQRVWDITVPSKCYSQDLGSVYREPGTGVWLQVYGAVSDLNGISTCVIPGYSEDIFVTWSTTDGIEFGQELDGVDPPLTLLTSADYAAVFGQGPGGCPTCTGWHIGDPAIVYGASTGTWYMFFDTQSCDSLANGKKWDPLSVATSAHWDRGWTIQAKVTSLPGHGPFTFPRIFEDPTDGRIYLFYTDTWLQIRAAELIDDGTGTNLVPVNGGSPILPSGSADSMSVYHANGNYWAVSDNFGDGTMQGLRTFWRMGPTSSPFVFNWSSRQELLGLGDWYSWTMWAPSCLGPDKTGDGTVHIYFWGNGDSGNSCVPGGSTQTGLMVVAAGGTPPPLPFVVESRSGGRNYSNYSETGTWRTDGASKSGAVGCTGGIGHRWCTIGATGYGTATFRFTPTTTGRYEVFTTNCTTSNSGNPLIHKETHAGGTTNVGVCQNTTCSPNPVNTWYSLGQYTMNAGTQYTVTLDGSTAAGSAPATTGVGRSDAIRWRLVCLTEPPTITQDPSNQTVPLGGTANFTVAATGIGNPIYQWQKNTTDITNGGHYSGCTATTLTVSNASVADTGSYRCMVTIGCGSAPSNAALLTIARPADFDSDTDVDLNDFALLQTCLGVVNPLGNPTCAPTDLNGDNAVNHLDVNRFKGCMSGSKVPSDVNCIVGP